MTRTDLIVFAVVVLCFLPGVVFTVCLGWFLVREQLRMLRFRRALNVARWS